ncbi:hypothetical protein [Pseudomonas sp. SJZ079]|uniref:hypothetical protein n=1 Tax=Pseudomonas sp. SJZ079 TaxID=2572887 RepID=UPI0011BFBEEE|nr:hypothetical protein [Pseudomonas sp. SJZ079]
MHEVKIKELNLKDTLRILWGFLWRGLTISVASVLAGGILGAIFGFIAGLIIALSGGSKETIESIAGIGGGVLGLISGIFLFYIYICWLLKAKFGKYKLALLEEQQEQHPASV